MLYMTPTKKYAGAGSITHSGAGRLQSNPTGSETVVTHPSAGWVTTAQVQFTLHVFSGPLL